MVRSTQAILPCFADACIALFCSVSAGQFPKGVILALAAITARVRSEIHGLLGLTSGTGKTPPR
eukprot:15441757-Alexandrium_andersonii.AAC.1